MVALLHVVVDTNVVFEGLTRQGGASSFVVEAWLSGLLSVHVSDALAYEYVAVLSRQLAARRWETVRPILSELLARAEFVTIHYRWRPSSPDPADEHVIDCAMNAAATVITHNTKDFRMAQQGLGLRVMTPVQLVLKLTE
jgi:predicted nucleic acid-binding protein